MSQRSHTVRLSERQVIVAAQAADGAQGKDIAQALDVSPATVCRDLLAIRERAYPANEVELQILIAEQDAVLQLMEDKLLKGLPPDVCKAWLNIRQEYASLHGLNKPTKHVTATVDARGPLYFEYLEHVARLSPENKEKVFAYADALPSTAMVIEPELLQLGEGQ